MILRGWKSMAGYAGVHVRTLKSWHYEKAKIPFLKSKPGKAGKISIPESTFINYLHTVFAQSIISYTTKAATFWTPAKKR